jgi:hypothetical protein
MSQESFLTHGNKLSKQFVTEITNYTHRDMAPKTGLDENNLFLSKRSSENDKDDAQLIPSFVFILPVPGTSIEQLRCF